MIALATGEPSIADFSARLWTPTPAPADDRLTRLLDAALAEATDDVTRRAALRGWRGWRTLTTGPHVCPTYGPKFLGMDRLVTARCPAGTVPIVGAWSGVPFDNGARPLHLRFTGPIDRVVRPGTVTARNTRDASSRRTMDGGPAEHRVKLSRRRTLRGLVHAALSPPDLEAVLDDLQPAARALVADPMDDYPRWALETADRIQARVLGRPRVSIDLNRLVVRYLLEVVDDPRHPIGRLFVDPVARARWCALLPHDPWFLAHTIDGRGRPAFEPLRCVGDHLEGPTTRLAPSPAPVRAALAEGRLCPALCLTFGVLVGSEGVRCLGGRRQGRYLDRFRAAWRALGLPLCHRPGPEDASATARGADGRPLLPLDLALDGRPITDVVPDWTPLSWLGHT